MDNLVLQAAVLELRREILGLRLHRVVPEGADRMMLLLGEGWGEEGHPGRRRRVFLGLDPPLIHLSRQRTGTPAAPTPFQGLLGREASGGAVVRVDKAAWERVVSVGFRLEGADSDRERELVVELIGERPRLLLLGEEGRVIGFTRGAGKGGRAGPLVGEPYEPPAPGARLEPGRIDEVRFRELAGPDPTGLGRRLARALLGMDPVVCDALERGAAAGEDPWARFREWRDRAVAGRFEPCLLVRGEVDAPDPRAARLTPFPIPLPPGVEERRFESAGEAIEAFRLLGEEDRALSERRASLVREVARKSARLERLEARLGADLAREDQAEELSRQATALLSGLGRASVDGDRARLPDPFGAPGEMLTVAIDPRLSLRANADRLFHRARKSRRGRETVTRRIEEVRGLLRELREAGGRIERAPGLRALDGIEQELARSGALRLVRRPTSRRLPAPPGTAPEVLPIQSFRSKDGMEILMGRTGKDNDLLTFKIAAPHDFWLHAQGHAGAHVVVRNPERLTRLPRATLEQAARLAAFHSKARGSARVEVMFTRRRQVRKGRNLPAGMVRVQRHETVLVAPTMPFAPEEV